MLYIARVRPHSAFLTSISGTAEQGSLRPSYSMDHLHLGLLRGWWGGNPSTSSSRLHIPVCATRATFFRAVRNLWTGAWKFRVIVKDCPLLKTRRRELRALVWCSPLFSAAFKSQLLILRAVVEKREVMDARHMQLHESKAPSKSGAQISCQLHNLKQATLLNFSLLLRLILPLCRVLGVMLYMYILKCLYYFYISLMSNTY